MESPPSSSTWSEAFILSDDSGLLLTNSSNSSGSNRFPFEFQDSDCDDKSFSQDDSLGVMCGENFNTLKKGPPNWPATAPIDPPLEFQDEPQHHPLLDDFSQVLAAQILDRAVFEYRERRLKLHHRPHLLLGRPYYASDFVPFSPCHGRPGSRSSLGSSRLSSSHNSLSVRRDDSSFITQAVSHDTLSSNQISDLYTVPFDSDMYAVPVDVVQPPPLKPKRAPATKKRRQGGRKKSTITIKSDRLSQYQWCVQKENKRHSVAGTSAPESGEPIHMTLQEVRHYLQTLYSSSSDSSEHKERTNRRRPSLIMHNTVATPSLTLENGNKAAPAAENEKKKKSTITSTTFLINIKNKKVKDSCDNTIVSCGGKQINISSTPPITNSNTSSSNNNNKKISVDNNNKQTTRVKKSPAKLFSFKQTLCNMFRFKRFLSPEHVKCSVGGVNNSGSEQKLSTNYINHSNFVAGGDGHNNISSRALPPLPLKEEIVEEEEEEEHILDFATSIQRVKDYGWYWGPLPSEVAEKILSNEPDGSFIVRDSSDDHYIFSLTFKLNNCVRHVRIDHDQGNFSFGSCTKFKSQTIVEFIENAVEHSRSGRYLFFLHRRPVIGPVRVQLLHPVSRFKQVQSLQHICRFVIHKVVRRDLIPSLPLPRRMIDYLNTPHYYSEHLVDVEDGEDASSVSVQSRIPTPAIRRNDDDGGEELVVGGEAAAPEDIPNVPFNNYVLLDDDSNNSPRQS